MECEKMILIFDTDEEKEEIISEFKEIKHGQYWKYFGENASSIYLEEAPEPKEILWENINYPRKRRYARIFVGWLLSVLFVASVTVIFYFILVEKSELLE